MLDSVGSVKFEDPAGQEAVLCRSEGTGRLMTGEVGNLIFSSIQLAINCTYELKSMDIVLHSSRKGNSKDFREVSLGNKEFAMQEMPNSGVCLSVRQSCIDLCFKERKIKIIAYCSGFKAVTFRFVSEILKRSDHINDSSLLLPSLNYLQELSFSDCTFDLWFRPSHSDSCGGCVHSDGKISHMVDESQFTKDTEESRTCSFGLGRKFNVGQRSIVLGSSHMVLVNISLGETYMAGSHIKDMLLGAHKANKFESSFSVGEGFQKISCQTQVIPLKSQNLR